MMSSCWLPLMHCTRCISIGGGGEEEGGGFVAPLVQHLIDGMRDDVCHELINKD